MSNTIIFGFDQQGNCADCIQIKNAWRGAMAVWQTLENRYLPMFRPGSVKRWNDVPDEVIENMLGYRPSRLIAFSSNDAVHEIWELFNNEKLTLDERIVLGTTFDHVLVKREDIPRVIEAYKAFEGDTSLGEQANALQHYFDNPTYTAVGWNANDVSCDDWLSAGGTDDETDDDVPYNFKTMDKHWWLFDELKAQEETDDEQK